MYNGRNENVKRALLAEARAALRQRLIISAVLSLPVLLMAMVPALVWLDPYLLVEKFVPERVDVRYAVRTYHCFGEHESCFLLTSPHPLVKSGPETETQELEPDPRLRTIRRGLGLDYGKIDYVLVDDTPVILDVNKTVGLSRHFVDDPIVAQARRERARAIHEYLR